MKHSKLSLAHILFAARLSLVLLIGATILEIVLMVTANMGAVWNNELRRITLETIFLILVFLSVGTLIITLISKKILKPFHDLQHGIHEVSKGNFDVNIMYDQNDEFAEVVKCFNHMVIELNGIQTMRNDFINTFSHECKTPIASIRGFAKQLKRPELTDAEKEEYLDIIISESYRLSHLYQNILSLSRYSNQEFMTNQELFSLDEQIRRCIVLLQKSWVKKNLELDIQLQSMDYYGNEEMLSQVWINLLSNAVKFSDEGGTIYIHGTNTRKKMLISIRDEGIGMDDQIQQHIFEQFYRGNIEKEGNGIGLAIVERIIQLCEGTIHVNSKIANGTEIIIELPKNTSKDS